MKRNLLIVVGTLAIVFLLGLTRINLVDTEMKENSKNNKGHLIGVFITMEHLDLFNFEAYLKNNGSKILSGGPTNLEDSKEYQGRIYATLTDKVITNDQTGEKTTVQDYVFEGLEGFSIFCTTESDEEELNNHISGGTGDGISDVQVSFAFTDEVDSVTLEGTVYISPVIASKVFYMNPVYQSTDGRVYVTTGFGVSNGNNSSDGAEFSYNYDETDEVIENGKTKKNSCSVKISFQVITPAKTVRVLQMDSNHKVIVKQEFTPDTMPESITPEEGASYLIVEEDQNSQEGTTDIERKIYQESDDTLETFLSQKNGICIKQCTNLIW